MARGRMPVSEEMRQSRFVRDLEGHLEGRLRYTSGSILPGELGADTVGPHGFSLRVFSSQSHIRQVSVLNITGGRPQVWFSSEAKLKDLLPERLGEVARLAALVREMGGDMSSRPYAGKTWVPLDSALRRIADLASIALSLAGEPPAFKRGHQRLQQSHLDALMVREDDVYGLWCESCSADHPCATCVSKLQVFMSDDENVRNVARVLEWFRALNEICKRRFKEEGVYMNSFIGPRNERWFDAVSYELTVMIDKVMGLGLEHPDSYVPRGMPLDHREIQWRPGTEVGEQGA